MAKVFIGIPTFNRPTYVQETVESILAQSYTDWEAVVSDNCSEPVHVQAVSDYVDGLNDSRIRFHQQPENGGEYGQGRYFFREAQDSDYLVILHDDDLLCPSYLEHAVTTLEQPEAAELAFYLADPYAIDAAGNHSDDMTEWYMQEHGRVGVKAGSFDILDRIFRLGFAPICGTVFRLSALHASGFIDDDCTGNYPFEFNVFLRLGDKHFRAWYHPEQLLAFRFHLKALRKQDKLMDNRHVVDTMITLLERRHYTGHVESRRRILLGRLYRAKCIIELQQQDKKKSRKSILKALHYFFWSKKTLLLAPWVVAFPTLLCWLLPYFGKDIAVPPALNQ